MEQYTLLSELCGEDGESMKRILIGILEFLEPFLIAIFMVVYIAIPLIVFWTIVFGTLKLLGFLF